MDNMITNLFNLSGKTAVVTGGAGVLCGSMCRALAANGVKVAVLDLNAEAADILAEALRAEGADAISGACDVLDKPSIEAAARLVSETFGRVDILVNGAGGNKPAATTNPAQSFFDLPAEAMDVVNGLPPGRYTRLRLCDQLNSAIVGRGLSASLGTHD